MDYIDTISLDEQLTEPLELHHNSCFYCNGYYGPCFGEPVCGTCHDFMYAEDFGDIHELSSYMCSSDEGDSGNDEPSEEATIVNRIVDSEPEMNLIEEPEEAAQVPAPPIARTNNIPAAPAQVVEVEPTSRHPDEEPSTSNNGFPTESKKLAERLKQLTTPWKKYEVKTTMKEDITLVIPPEIWATIFKKLDDVSLMMVSKVNSKWRAIVRAHFPMGKWKDFVNMRWPLFHPIYEVCDWYSVYSDFIDSVPCKLCFMSLIEKIPEMDFSGKALRTVRLNKELKWLKMDRNPEGIEAVPLDAKNFNWLARINGPPQSQYQGGVFYLNVKVPHDYPLKPPIVRFLTKIFHPNISRHGDIGIDCIQHNWTLALTIPQILLSVQSLLTDPYLVLNMEPSIAKLFQEDYTKFSKIARIWTWKYAMHDTLVH